MACSIKVEDVSLDIPIFGMHSRSFRQVLLRRHVGGPIVSDGVTVVRALRDVSFEARAGDRIALIGHNGAGKTTMLRLLAGVYRPTAGTIAVEGKSSALLNTGLGLDPEGDAFENIVNMGLLLGMSYGEIRRKTDSIAAFTELGDYLRLPVRTYSAGMLMRLSFAVITAIEPEVLLLDEGFGAGDARFARRAKERVDGLIERTNIMVLASHSEDMVRQMCNLALLLDGGRLKYFGPVEDALRLYALDVARGS